MIERPGMTRSDRHGPSWDAFLMRYRITGIEGDASPYRVRSVSGKTYTVETHTRLDENGALFAWRCNCAARKRCRHIDAIVNMRWAEAQAAEDYDLMDVMEREEI